MGHSARQPSPAGRVQSEFDEAIGELAGISVDLPIAEVASVERRENHGFRAGDWLTSMSGSVISGISISPVNAGRIVGDPGTLGSKERACASVPVDCESDMSSSRHYDFVALLVLQL